MHILLTLALMFVGVWSSSVPARQARQSPPRTLVLTDAVLIDGTGAGPRPGMTLVIEGALLTQITDGFPSDVPDDAEVLDASGRFVVPGLFEAHTHLATNPSAAGYREEVESKLRAYLGRGITDVRDMAGDARVLAYLARQTSLGELPGPDIHYSALLAGPAYFGDPRIRAASRGAELGHTPWAHEVDEDTDLGALMQRVRGAGARGVKLYAEIDTALVPRIAAAAHQAGLGVWSHWILQPGRTRALDAVNGGVDVVSHAFMLMHDASPAERVSFEAVMDAANGAEMLDAMSERGTILDATLIAAAGLRAPPDWVEPSAFAAALVRAARAAGVLVAAGSDHPGDGETFGVHLEYGLLVRDAGFTPLEVIEAASRIGALACGLEDSRGTLEVGKEATFLVLAGDPVASVDALATPDLVVKRGVVFSGPELRESDGPVAPAKLREGAR